MSVEEDALGRSAGGDARRRTAASHRPRVDRARLAYLKDLTLHLARRELAIRHRGSLLGWLWSLLPALLLLLVTYFLFTRVIPLGVENYPVFLLVGILAWTWFAGGLRAATGSLEAGRNLVLRPGFPTMLLPLVATLVDLVDYLIALPILFGALALTTGVTVESLLLPVLLVIQLFLVVGLGLVVAPLQLFFRDIRQFVLMAVGFGFWLTPIFYRERQVPETFKPLYDVNPMAHLIEAQRGILLDGAMPPALSTLAVGLVSVFVLVCGCAVFSALRHSLPERL